MYSTGIYITSDFMSYIRAPESGSKTGYIVFIVESAENPIDEYTIYQKQITIGQTEITGLEVEYSSLEKYGVTLNGSLMFRLTIMV